MKPKKESHAESIERIFLFLALLSFVWVLVPSGQLPALIAVGMESFFSWMTRASDSIVGYVTAQINGSSAAMEVGSWAVMLYVIVRGVRWIRATTAAAESRQSDHRSGEKEASSQARI